jgi:hypothetical protein
LSGRNKARSAKGIEMSEITLKLYGINDDSDTCSECGKTNLKRVMWIGSEDTDPAPYGTTCGARELSVNPLGGSKKVWSNVIRQGIVQIIEARTRFMSDECFLRQNMAVPKPMIFVEWREVQKGELTMAEFVAARDEQFPIMQSFDVGSFFNEKRGIDALNDRLRIAENAPVGIKVVRN